MSFLMKKLVVGVSAGIMAASAFATTTVVPTPSELYGGGATLPAIAYIGTSWLNIGGGNPVRLSATNYVNSTTNATTGAQDNNSTNIGNSSVDADSLFGAYFATGTAKKPTPQISYCQTGSGNGRKVLYGLYAATTTCTDYGLNNPTGFSAPADMNFAASDAPLLGTEYASFISARGATHGEPVQIPSIAGAIAVVYNAGASGATGQLILTESQICQVFSGEITNWNQLGAFASQPITVIYRTDGSGTSFNFTNHLSAVCPTAVGGTVGAVTPVFTTNSTFSSGDTALTAGTGAIAATAIGENGNGAVVTEVVAVPGSIGYAEVADAVARSAAAGGAGIQYAAVKIQANVAATTKYTGTLTGGAGCLTATGPATKTCKAVKVPAQTFKSWDPIANFPKSQKVKWISDTVLGNNSLAGRPLLETVAAGSGDTPVKAGCMQIVDPNTIAIPALSKGDYTQYPIEAVTYLLGFQTGNGASAPYIQALLQTPLALSSKVKTIGTGQGYAALTSTLDSGAAATTTKALVTACIGS